MERSETPIQVTDLHGQAPAARQCIREALMPLVGAAELSYDFYREWSGGWRCRVAVAGRARAQLDFVLFHTPQGGILALPLPMPERLRAGPGVRASDGSLWTLDADGQVAPANG